MTIKKKIRLSNIMMVLIPILFTTIVLIVFLNTSLGSYWHTFMDMYSDENGVQFAQSMIYNYQQELWENNWRQTDTKPIWPLMGLPENKKQKQKSMMPFCWM